MEIKVYNQWDKASIRPGVVGSVGDALGVVKLRTSAPDMDPRYDRIFSPSNEPFRGSNISDGTVAGFTSGGWVAKTLERPLPYRQGFKYNLGWIHEDLRPTDRSRTSIMGSTGNLDWETTVANVFNAKLTGENFLPVPGGYGPSVGQVPRGSQIPRIVDASAGEGIPEPADDISVTDARFGKIGGVSETTEITVEEPIKTDWYWTPKDDDPRRKLSSEQIIDYLKRNRINVPLHLVERGTFYNTYAWLDDKPDKEQVGYFISAPNTPRSVIAAHTGAKARPKNELPTYIKKKVTEMVPKPGDERKKAPPSKNPPTVQ